jgi:hypothetical protein
MIKSLEILVIFYYNILRRIKMKKLVLSLVLGASLAIVPSAFALKAMTDTNMKDTTGQAGVSIVVDDIILFQSSVSSTTYTDVDGVDQTNGGSITITNDMPDGILTTMRAVFSAGDRNGFLQNDYAAILAANGVVNTGIGMDGTASFDDARFAAGNAAGYIAKPITIDVAGALDCASYGFSYNVAGAAGAAAQAVKIAGISIGLPTIEINRIDLGDTTTIITANSTTAGLANNDGEEYIRITKQGSNVTTILGGTVEIAPHQY